MWQGYYFQVRLLCNVCVFLSFKWEPVCYSFMRACLLFFQASVFRRTWEHYMGGEVYVFLQASVSSFVQASVIRYLMRKISLNTELLLPILPARTFYLIVINQNIFVFNQACPGRREKIIWRWSFGTSSSERAFWSSFRRSCSGTIAPTLCASFRFYQPGSSIII